MISGYNEEAPPVRNLMQIVAQEIRLYGFIVGSLLPEHREDFYAKVPGMIARGELKWKEEKTAGIENADKVILAVQRGQNKAKSIVVIADE
jgi:NADPH-dependent curcumin reductase CurA